MKGMPASKKVGNLCPRELIKLYFLAIIFEPQMLEGQSRHGFSPSFFLIALCSWGPGLDDIIQKKLI